MAINGTETITITNASDIEPYTLVSSDSAVATVDAFGVITGVANHGDHILGGKVFARASVENIDNVDIKPNLTLKVTSLSGETIFNDTKIAMIFPENQSQMEIY